MPISKIKETAYSKPLRLNLVNSSKLFVALLPELVVQFGATDQQLYQIDLSHTFTKVLLDCKTEVDVEDALFLFESMYL